MSLDINQVMAMGRTVRGIVEGEPVPQVFLPRLIELWRQGRFPIDRIMTHYDFREIAKAARDAEEGRVVKPVLRMKHALTLMTDARPGLHRQGVRVPVP